MARKTISLSKQRITAANGDEYVYWRAQFYNSVGRRIARRVGRANGKEAISKKAAMERCNELAAQMLIRPSRRDARRAITLKQFRAEYFEARPRINAATRAAIDHTFALLISFFGADKKLDHITADDALRWESSLVKGTRKRGEKTEKFDRSVATIRRHVRTAKALFGTKRFGAVGRGFIAENPFALLDGSSKAGTVTYITEADAEKVIEELPHWSLRNAFALARYCGLRCPSEVSGLIWDDIAWKSRRLTVHDVKRSRVEQQERRERVVLLDERAEKWLLKGFASSPARNKLVCPRLPHKSNLSRSVTEAITRAGVTPWPKLFQSLRQSAERDWADRYPQHVVSTWLGHSIEVSGKHYLAIGEEHYRPDYGAKLSQNLSQTPQKADRAGV